MSDLHQSTPQKPIPSENPTLSFWLSPANEYVSELNYHTTDKLPDTTETLIIGAGMSGMSAAYWLSKEESTSHITILDARSIGGGATGRNGGHCWPDPLLESFEYQISCQKLMESYIQENHLEEIVQFKRTDGITLLFSTEEAERNYQLTSERRDPTMFRKIDATHEELLEQRFKLPHVGGFFDSNASQFWPAKFLYTLKQKLIATEKTLVTGVAKEEGSYLVDTSRGKIRAKNVIYATNAYLPYLLPQLKNVVTPIRGQIVVTSPLPPIWKDSMAFGEIEYCIQRQDGRIVLGGKRFDAADGQGERNNYNDNAIEANVGKALREYLRDMFGVTVVKNKEELDQLEGDKKCYIEIEWTGIMGFTPDHRPLVGRLAENGEGAEYILGGFNGSGMTHCFKSGLDIANLILSKSKGDSSIPQHLHLFDPLRKQVGSVV